MIYELKGSDKQISWATDIRKQFKNESDLFDWSKIDNANDLIEFIFNNDRASWWINNRLVKFKYLVQDAMDLMAVQKEKSLDDQLFNDILLESIISPDDPVSETITEISIRGFRTIQIKFIERRDDFKKLMKNNGYRWNSVYSSWDRKINKLNGLIEDRIVEIANKLLLMGLKVSILDEDLRSKAINADYKDECERWILARTEGNYKNHFAIRWSKNYDYYTQAKRITGSIWDKPDVVVKAIYYNEIHDFADIHGFKFDELALQLKEKAIDAENKIFTTTVRAKDNKKMTRVIDTELDNIEILDEFREDLS